MVALLWKLEPATAAKHRLYKRYLDAWWPIMLQPNHTGYRRPRVTYVDAFAGPGRYEDGEDGSPVFAIERLLTHSAVGRMNLSRDRVTMLFIERDTARWRYLRELVVSRFGPLERLPVRVEIRNADAGVDTEGMLTELDAWRAPILAVFDSWGNVNVPYDLVRRIAGVRSSEVITTFGPNWFSRRETLNTDLLDVVFGGRSFWQPADREQRPDERWRTWLDTYRSALARAGFAFQLQFEVVPHTGQPLYLVFGTGSEKGVEVMKDAMWNVDGDGGMSFRDPRTRGGVPDGQLDLFAEIQQTDELTELLTQRLHEGRATVHELGGWLLCETARWRRTHARAAVTAMRDAGLVALTPHGRITKQALVELHPSRRARRDPR
ncbi:three-Cys-motif partner protein TcmP [Pseudonocardia humida]|uniref:Three-Cys-motif partner protein TcmP n=1 Tax=Pseudonocardia humida TaxID=2800819 RepID=A0ABT1A849_9PSEU|nr:three-Cys-motif partner protein TcmP [Pseudonocardia humida]MCO1659199.1 three-Cys-motif partner protein TcmP [Pseudonocardia humida]